MEQSKEQAERCRIRSDQTEQVQGGIEVVVVQGVHQME